MQNRPENRCVGVIGAAGHTGAPLLGALKRRGHHVKAIVRSDDRRGAASSADTIAIADLSDVNALNAALTGVDVVYFIPPLLQDNEEGYAVNAITAALACGVERFVYHSVLHPDTPTMPHHARKARVEIILRESAIAWTIVQPAMYMDTPLRLFDRPTLRLRPPFSIDRLFNPIDPRDLSEAIARILTEPGHDYAAYELAGRDRLSFRDMAGQIGEVIGQPVDVEAVDVDQLIAGRNYTPAMGRQAKAMFNHYDRHGLCGNSNVLEMIIKRQAGSFMQFIKDRFGADLL